MDTWDHFRDKSKPYEYLSLYEGDHRDKPADPAGPIITLRVSDRQLSKIPEGI
jgi:hypothetical protein